MAGGRRRAAAPTGSAGDRAVDGDTGAVTAARRPVGPAPMSEWLSDGVLLIGPDPDGTVAAIAIDLPVEPGAVTVVSLLTSIRDWTWLTDAVIAVAPPGATVRLAISDAGAPDGAAPAPARRLAERLRADVIAPDGRVLLTPGGTAFVAPRAGPATPGRARGPRAAPASGCGSPRTARYGPPGRGSRSRRGRRPWRGWPAGARPG